MIRAVIAWSILRSVDSARALSWPVRALVAASRNLQRLERDLRTADRALRSSTAGLVDTPPPWLAAQTAARLRAAPTSAAAGSPLWSRLLLAAAAIGGVGAVAAAVILAGGPFLRAAPPAGGAPLQQPPVAHVPTPNEDAPVIANATDEGEAAPLLVAAVLTPRQRVAGADVLSTPLLAEARRLRDDTQAAASFVLDRLRIIGPSPDR